MKEWFDGIITWFQTTFSFLADKELLMMIGIGNYSYNFNI